jgi:undecaprenyl-diphosphatase
MTRKTWISIGVAVLALIVASAIDPWVFHHVQKPNVYDQDWGRALRSVGYWPLWMVLSLALGLVDRQPRRAAYLAGSITVAGIIGELLKLIVRRQRPGTLNGVYAFRSFADHLFSSRNFGMPSSHAVIAFSGAAAMSILFPEATVVWYALAIGCGVTRILSGAHFLSDVVAGAAIGIAVSVVIARRLGSRLRQ